MAAVKCDNCGNVATIFDLVPLENVPDLTSRIDPGAEIPAGECRECGALSYLQTE